jgi:cell division protein FtsB
MDQTTKDAFAKLTQTVERGFAAVAEDIADIRARMATKDDLAALRTELKGEISDLRTEMRDGFASIREELRDIRRRLESLEEAARNSTGLTKEIDHLMERVRAIEKHLGIKTKIAA